MHVCVVISSWKALCLSLFFLPLSPEPNQRRTDCFSSLLPQYPSSFTPFLPLHLFPLLVISLTHILAHYWHLLECGRQAGCFFVWEKGHCFQWHGCLLFQTETCNFQQHTMQPWAYVCVCVALVVLVEKVYLAGEVDGWDRFIQTSSLSFSVGDLHSSLFTLPLPVYSDVFSIFYTVCCLPVGLVIV